MPKSEQKERLAAALRENLKRRKARAKALADQARQEPAEGGQEPDSDPKNAGKPD